MTKEELRDCWRTFVSGPVSPELRRRYNAYNERHLEAYEMELREAELESMRAMEDAQEIYANAATLNLVRR